ncbi:hypothetical protein [Pedobacter jamesrossensis]|uniref:Uncharacterized protein n=1 Tax=Pedobacter jamesrossensis TaxID=1908238 RepID=A0ABV8NME2_9SPHI
MLAYVQDLEEVHERIKKDSKKSYDPDEVKPEIDGLSEQIKGSDADSDKSLGKESEESNKQKQNQGSDAGKN